MTFDLCVFKSVVFTDKTKSSLTLNKYVFVVDKSFTKTGLKSLVENTFSVKVNSLNSYIPASKKKRLNKYTGFKSTFKRIIVTLKRILNIRVLRIF
uniref:Large ribosomal subunit protein uL23c n=1 Tax=Lepocinclis tripteris TaxID=135494 RepID=A0A3G3LKZ5_9EUGL|nr:ribosomal protein L23 [Lepocinclis tripteris]AYQ93382.1 ribosomal protein L23 [Lepocinclis tripteris]